MRSREERWFKCIYIKREKNIALGKRNECAETHALLIKNTRALRGRARGWVGGCCAERARASVSDSSNRARSTHAASHPASERAALSLKKRKVLSLTRFTNYLAVPLAARIFPRHIFFPPLIVGHNQTCPPPAPPKRH